MPSNMSSHDLSGSLMSKALPGAALQGRQGEDKQRATAEARRPLPAASLLESNPLAAINQR